MTKTELKENEVEENCYLCDCGHTTYKDLDVYIQLWLVICAILIYIMLNIQQENIHINKEFNT